MVKIKVKMLPGVTLDLSLRESHVRRLKAGQVVSVIGWIDCEPVWCFIRVIGILRANTPVYLLNVAVTYLGSQNTTSTL